MVRIMLNPTKAEAIAMLRGGLAEQFQKISASYVLPICWLCADNGKPLILGSGTAFMLNCGSHPFLVTANHVYEGYLHSKSVHEDTVCLLGDLKFPLEDRSIARDSVVDVSTFRLEPSEVSILQNSSNPKLVLTNGDENWPPASPKVDCGVFFAGFPGDGRSLRKYRGNSNVEIDWNGYTALAVATAVSETDITLVFEHESNFDVGLRPKAPDDQSLGGCSGAPLLSFIERNGVFSWALCGIIYEASGQILKASCANCLNADGSINKHPNPMAYLR